MSTTPQETGDHPAEAALVIGMGGIGSALAQRWKRSGRFASVWGVSRRARHDDHDRDVVGSAPFHHLTTDHTPENIRALVEEVASAEHPLSYVAITLGTLHGSHYGPEKSLSALDPQSMLEVHRVNMILPMLWLSVLTPILRKSPNCRVAVLSARVGSIGDNQLGGWYSYRSSKAALNMALRCAAIELSRRAKGVKLIAYHPGTVDTGLSQPFQKSVPEGKLFSADYAAERLDTVMQSVAIDGSLSYLDWAGNTIDW